MKKETFILKIIKDINKKKIILSDNNISILYQSDKLILFKQDFKSKTLWVSYYLIWEVLEIQYNMKQTDIQQFIKNTMENHLKIKDFTPRNFCWRLK